LVELARYLIDFPVQDNPKNVRYWYAVDQHAAVPMHQSSHELLVYRLAVAGVPDLTSAMQGTNWAPGPLLLPERRGVCSGRCCRERLPSGWFLNDRFWSRPALPFSVKKSLF